MKRYLIFLFGILFSVPSTLFGQQEEQREAFVIFTTRDKAGNEIIEWYKQTESPYLQDPRAPRFMLIDKKRQYSLGIGGYIKLRVAGDFNGENDKHSFTPFHIHVPNSPLTNGNFRLDASDSRLFLKLVGTNRILGDFSAYIETDFQGANNNMRLRHAYLSARGFLLGQSWSTFTDLASIPPTIDSEGPCSNTSLRTVQVRYTCNIDPHWQIAIAVESPEIAAALDDDTRSISQRIPDIPVYLQYSWRKNSHLRASAVFRGMSYNDRLTNRNRSVFGWGVQLSGTADIGSVMTVYGQGVYGKGIARYIDELENGTLDIVPNRARPGYEQALPMFGAYGGLKFNLTSRMFISGTYSQVRLYSRQNYGEADDYRYSQYVVGNCFYHLTRDCQIGIEYLYGRRVNFDGQSGHANRAQAMIQYNF